MHNNRSNEAANFLLHPNTVRQAVLSSPTAVFFGGATFNGNKGKQQNQNRFMFF